MGGNTTPIDVSRVKDAADAAEKITGARDVQNPQVRLMISTIEAFLRAKRRICYGGTAINNVLPPDARFYDAETELPDYDFLSPAAFEDAQQLANFFKKTLGFESVEMRQGMHHGTYKVFVDYRGIADITQTPERFFNQLTETALDVDGILYVSPEYLRMSMYLELSRPAGDVSRWGKVYNRLQLLNKHHPIGEPTDAKSMFATIVGKPTATDKSIHAVVLPFIAENSLVSFGYNMMLFYEHWNDSYADAARRIRAAEANYMLLSTTASKTAEKLAKALRAAGVKSAIVGHPGLGEIIPTHKEIRTANRSIFVYQTIACHSFYTVGKLNIASADTMLSLYLAFLFTERKYYDHALILDMSRYLVARVHQLRTMARPPIPAIALNCIGVQPSLIDFKKEYVKRVAEYKKLVEQKKQADAKIARKTLKTTRKHGQLSPEAKSKLELFLTKEGKLLSPGTEGILDELEKERAHKKRLVDRLYTNQSAIQKMAPAYIPKSPSLTKKKKTKKTVSEVNFA